MKTLLSKVGHFLVRVLGDSGQSVKTLLSKVGVVGEGNRGEGKLRNVRTYL